MIVIVGESACGKSSVAKCLVNNYGYKRIVTYTTRKPRDVEVDGFDYFFINQEEFEEREMNGFFAETATYNEWMYGSAKEDYEDNCVIILTPRGLRTVKKAGIENIFSVYIDVPRRDRIIKSLERGDNIEEVYRRSVSDAGQFDGISDEVDLVLKNEKYIRSVEDITAMIDTVAKNNLK